MTETAFVSISLLKAKRLRMQKYAGAEALVRLKENPRKVLATILLWNNAANVAGSALATLIATPTAYPIARIAPVTGAPSTEGRREELLRTGRLRAPRAKLPRYFRDRKRPADPKGKGLTALLAERESGW